MTFRLLRILTLLALGIFACEIVSFAGPAEGASYFRVEQRRGIWWFKSPDGKPFYSLGVNVVDMGPSREAYNPSSPEYAAFLHYRSPEAWASTTLQRLRSWNFNTLGGWSSREAPRDAMPYTLVLHLGGTARVPWSDIFGADVWQKFDEAARRQVAPLAKDKNLIGYFSDNELGWWDDTLLDYYLKQPSTNATRQVLMRLLREHYRNDFSQLLLDFEPSESKSFADLDHHSALTIKPGGHAMDVVDKFTFLVAERYYKLAHDAIRRYDSNHLILGDRYHGYVPRAVAQAAIPYVDVISTNYAADWTDGRSAEFYLSSLFRVTRKPILITEFYFSATENRSGNRNSSATFPVVATQKERARSFRRNMTELASLPFVVGAHWFQYYDEPTKGRSDGEDYNMGLVDIHDRPYEELTAAARALSAGKIHEQASLPEPAVKVVQQVPAANTAAERGLLHWNKARSFMASSASDPVDWRFADAYVCWSPLYLYLAVYAADFYEPLLYRGGRAGGKIPETERATLVVGTEGTNQLLSVRFGGKDAATIEGPAVWLRERNSPTRNTVLLRVPASMFGKNKLRPGDSLVLSATLLSHSRAERMEWQKVLRLTR
jgi:hypothetical protein